VFEDEEEEEEDMYDSVESDRPTVIISVKTPTFFECINLSVNYF